MRLKVSAVHYCVKSCRILVHQPHQLIHSTTHSKVSPNVRVLLALCCLSACRCHATVFRTVQVGNSAKKIKKIQTVPNIVGLVLVQLACQQRFMGSERNEIPIKHAVRVCAALRVEYLPFTLHQHDPRPFEVGNIFLRPRKKRHVLQSRVFPHFSVAWHAIGGQYSL